MSIGMQQHIAPSTRKRRRTGRTRSAGVGKGGRGKRGRILRSCVSVCVRVGDGVRLE